MMKRRKSHPPSVFRVEVSGPDAWTIVAPPGWHRVEDLAWGTVCFWMRWRTRPPVKRNKHRYGR